MKVLLINGSPRAEGNTHIALSEVAKALEANGVEAEIVSIGTKAVQGCIACGRCREMGRCVFHDELYDKVREAEDKGASADELRGILGKAVSKRGIFEGDTDNGELEIGQIASAIRSVRPVAEVMEGLVKGFAKAKERIMKS